MKQSNDQDPFNLNSLIEDDDYTINLDDYSTTTTTYWVGDSVSDITVTPSDGTFTITGSSNDNVTVDIGDWNLTGGFGVIDDRINPTTVEQMCKQYPGLEKVWRNFKSVYDMCKQDYEGKLKAGEIDDDIPF